MSPKYILVLLLALVFAASSFADYPKPPIRGIPKPHQDPSPIGGRSQKEQENTHVNNYPDKPSSLRGPTPPDGGRHHRKRPAEELSLQEQENSEVNNYPNKPPHKRIPPKHGNSQVDSIFHKPPHRPPHMPTTEELSLKEQENKNKNPNPGHHHVEKEN